MLSKTNRNSIGKVLLLLSFLMLLIGPVEAQNKKKKKYKKKSDANIIARGYQDVTTRNNYYFNASLLYKNILADVNLEHQTDYTEILPIYFHQKVESFEPHQEALDNIIKKTSVAMQLHDNTRWKDDVYLLLGKARYLNGEYQDALNTFQFVVTTMESEVGKTKGKVDNKAKLKEQKAKEAAKRAKERQKEIDQKKKELKDKLSQLKKDKEKEMAANSKEKEKSIAKKIKAKNKIIALRKKGKTVPQKLLDIAYGKEEELVDKDKPGEKEADKKEEAEEKEPQVTYKIDYRSQKKKQKQEEIARLNELAELNDTIPLTEKELKKFDDLTFWEKIKHKQARPEALVWMAKSLMKTGEKVLAQSILEYAEALPKLTREQREGVYAGEAYFYLEELRYENALESLEMATLYAKKKKKPYYQFIAAQIKERTQDQPGAMEFYEMVADGKSDYKMKFYANMKMVSILQDEQLESDELIVERLEKLIKNGSNKEFRDQLHYRIADIYSQQGNLDLTVEHLQESITSSRKNPLQKGLSFKALGDVYLLQELYPAAAVFYDSAVAVIPAEYKDAEEISFRAKTINKIADQALTIAETDSLLLLSGMTEQDLELYLAELKAKERVEERKRRKRGDVTDFITESVVVETSGNTVSGSWYFYNPNLRAQGYNQFKLIWGDRAYEYDWRRSSRESIFDIANISNINKTDVEKKEEVVEEKKELKIPATEEEIAEANLTLATAYYELGKLFKNQLEDNAKAKKPLEQLVNRYPDFERIDRAYYYLYLIYMEEGDMARAEHYKDILLTEYPVSQYAYAINHPYQPSDGNYRPEPTQVEQLYASAYDMFVEGRYTDVITSRRQAYNTYKESPLMPKFDFLEALSYGHLDSIPILKNKLGTIIASYPNHEVEKKAREYLAILAQMENEEGVEDTVVVATESDTTAFVSIYVNDESNSIFGMVTLSDPTIDLRQTIQLIDQYNDNTFASLKLRVSNAYLDKDRPIILIKRFREKSDAMDYIGQLQNSLGDIFGEDVGANINLLLISQDNFRTLFTTKKLEEYQTFYDQIYR